MYIRKEDKFDVIYDEGTNEQKVPRSRVRAQGMGLQACVWLRDAEQKVRQAMLRLVSTSKGGMDDLAAVFAKIDIDNSGSLSKEEFIVAMDSVELKLVPAEVDAIFAKY